MIIGSYNYGDGFINENLMGPNAMRVLDELIKSSNLKKGMKVLDLGCGKGLTSIFLAKEFGVTVYATDLWISATENYERFKAMGLMDLIIPIHADAYKLPYADAYFDAVISIDAYHYFGYTKDYMDKYLAPLVKPGGIIAMGIPGIKEEFGHKVPTAMSPYVTLDMNFHCCEWWQNLWQESELIEVTSCVELNCLKEAWDDWLKTDNSHAIEDRAMMKAENGQYFNLVGIIAQKR